MLFQCTRIKILGKGTGSKHTELQLLISFNQCVSNALLVPSELLLSTHLPTSEGWTTELTVGLRLVVPTTGFEPKRVDLARFETMRLNHSATPPLNDIRQSLKTSTLKITESLV